MKKCAWSQEAETALRSTFNDCAPDSIRANVESGRYELWRFEDRSWMLTEVHEDVVNIIAYAGRDMRRDVPRVMGVVAANRKRAYRFLTAHPGLPRMLKDYRPRYLGTVDGLKEFEVDCHVRQ